MSELNLSQLRAEYHRQICSNVLGRRAQGPFSNADRVSATSTLLAEKLAMHLGIPTCSDPPARQTLGDRFAIHTRDFVQKVVGKLAHLRPGEWHFLNQQTDISRFEQYHHLRQFDQLVKKNRELAALFGTDYLVAPDIVIFRWPVTNEKINDAGLFVAEDGTGFPMHSPLRSRGPADLPILHASISCKWTIRSDRAQNIRTEALNLTRYRKGRVPHMVAVTAEPMPSRIASIAFGTGDVDCVYHMALPELEAACNAVNNTEQIEVLEQMVKGRRLRDISDLPFDVVI